MIHSLYALAVLLSAVGTASCVTTEPVRIPQGTTFADVLVKNSCWQGTWSAGADSGGNMTLCFTGRADALAGEIRDMGGPTLLPVNGPIAKISVSEPARKITFTNVSGREHVLSLTANGGLDGYIHGTALTVRVELKPARR